MKRVLTALVVSGLLAGAMVGPAEAGKKKKKKPAAPKRIERVVDWAYQAPALGTPETPSLCLRPTMSCIDIPTGAGERYLSIEATDASGTPVAISLTQDTDPAALGSEHVIGTICGKTDAPVEIQPGAPIVGFPLASGGATCPGAFGTTGTIKATLSNLP